MRHFGGSLLAAAILVGAGGCGPETSPGGATDGAATKRVIGVVPMGATHNFWKSIHAGALRAAEEVGGVEILWKSGLKENDRDAQIKVVEDLITRKVAGIVLAPLDNTALRGPVHDAGAAGIPVVLVDSGLKSDRYVSLVATDNYVGGRKGARELAAQLQGKGRVVMLRCMEGAASTMAREQGFLDEMKAHGEIQVVSSNQYGGATTEEAYKASENLLAPFRRADGTLDLDGVFSSNESTTFGMLRALQDAGWAGKVRFVGFDSSEMLVAALRKGEIHGLVLQDPMNMGYLGVKTLLAHLAGQPVEKLMDTGSTVATLANVNEPAVKALLEPDFKRWLGE